MAIQTFTSGQILTAADTNTYLANSGLTYVASASYSGVTSFDVTGLSSTYLYYKLLFGGGSSVTTDYRAVLYNGGTALNSLYYAGVGYAAYDNSVGGANSSNSTNYFWAGQATNAYRSQTVMEFRMKASQQFTFTMQAFEANTFRAIHSAGFRNATDAFDRIRISSSGAPTMTGEWRLYGYREP
jgi:hypothetical protein